MSNNIFKSAAAVFLIGGLVTGAANANTIQFTSNWNDGIGAGSVTCVPNCEGLDDGIWSDSQADLYHQASNESAELAQLNSLLGLTGPNMITGYEKFDSKASTFNSMSYEYWAIKKATSIAYFKNPGNLPITFSFYDKNGNPVDWSHVTGFGSKVVPLPAAAYLFGSALLGMAGIGYRRNKKQA